MLSTKERTNIFISYRRADTAGHTGRLYDRLNHHFAGQAKIFMDLDTLAPGEDAITSIETAVGSCNALIVMIGDQWVSVKGADGVPRLYQPDDYVRNEVAVALKRNILVIPVLVEGAPMPQAKDLPPDLAKLVRLNALEISDSRWEHDTQRLTAKLEQELSMRTDRQGTDQSPGKSGLFSWGKIGAAVVALALLAGFSLWVRAKLKPSVASQSPTIQSQPPQIQPPKLGQQAAQPAPSSVNQSTPSSAPSSALEPLPANRTGSKKIDLLASENGGKLLIASSDYWKGATDGDTSWNPLQKNAFAVFAFKDEKPATIDTFTVFIGATSENNLKEFELLIGNDSPEGKFDSIGVFQTRNYRLVQNPFQEFKLTPVKARYLKVIVLSNHAGGATSNVAEIQLFGTPN